MNHRIKMEMKNGVTVCVQIPGELVKAIEVQREANIGDVNADGAVNQADAETIMEYLAGNTELDDAALARADANRDGSVSYLDAMTVMETREE